MARLIDADAFIASLEKYIDKPMTAGLCATLIETFPTAYDVEKVVVELENAKSIMQTIDLEEKQPIRLISLDRAIDIVKRGGVE